jgi:membrane protein DedA with SNARE-associated domain
VALTSAAGPLEAGGQGLGGLSGFVTDVVGRLGELGIGLLTMLETVFPPVPSEVILPLGGYLAQRGELSPVWVVVAATAGSLAGAWLLYGLGAALGEKRATTLLARLPLVDEEDVARSVGWFERRGAWAVLLGRLVPGVRSLVSLPAGAARMNLALFSALTLLGSGVWTGILVGAGMALGTQWQLVEEYSWVLDVVLVALVVAAVAALAVRRVRKRRRHATP